MAEIMLIYMDLCLKKRKIKKCIKNKFCIYRKPQSLKDPQNYIIFKKEKIKINRNTGSFIFKTLQKRKIYFSNTSR